MRRVYFWPWNSRHELPEPAPHVFVRDRDGDVWGADGKGRWRHVSGGPRRDITRPKGSWPWEELRRRYGPLWLI